MTPPLTPRRLSLILIGLILASTVGRAFAIDDVQTPRGLAMGGSGRAIATGSLGPLLNPAGMVAIRQYSMEAMYGFNIQNLGSSIHLGITDSVTNSRLAMGLYYQFTSSTPKFTYGGEGGPTQAARQGNETGVALALPLGERFSIGLTSKYSNVTTEVANPGANMEVEKGMPAPQKTLVLDSTNAADSKGFTMDAGVMLRLGDSFHIGVSGHNFIPLHSVEVPIGLGIGLGYMMGASFVITTDARIDFDKYRQPGTTDEKGNRVQGDRRTTAKISGGLEYLAGGVVPIRAGFAHDTGMPGSFLSLGIGYMGKSFGIDLGYRQKVNGGNEALLNLGLRVFL
ncbi:MAG: hypothetical protein EXR72_01630 [Myxococcales bacterium]|nr:hypothetical protein [Myxococcales bacterium]